MELSIARIFKHNTKIFYSYINKRRIVTDNKGSLKTLDGIIITTDNDRADKMNNYFSKVFTIEQINNVPHLGQYQDNILGTLNYSTREVHEKLRNMTT